MENFETLLAYQKWDIELRKVLDEIERSDDSKKLEQARNEFNTAKNAVGDSEKAAESVVNFFEKALSAQEECETRIGEIAAAMAKTEDINEQRALAEELEKLRDKLVDLERKLSEQLERTDKVIKGYLEGNERGKKVRAVYMQIKERLEKMRAERAPRINELKAHLDELRPKIDPKWLKLYESITAERKYPAFVEALPADKKEYRCFCGFQLSQKAKSELIDKGYCRCETCQRLVYMKS